MLLVSSYIVTTLGHRVDPCLAQPVHSKYMVCSAAGMKDYTRVYIQESQPSDRRQAKNGLPRFPTRGELQVTAFCCRAPALVTRFEREATFNCPAVALAFTQFSS